MKFKRYTLLLLLPLTLLLLPASATAQQTYPLPLDELFERGVENSLQIKAAHMQELIAGEKEKTARSMRLPDLKLSATTGYIGRPTIFKSGLAHPTHPDVPDWSHNYNVELTQPIYQGGRIEHSIRKAELEKEVARLSTTNDIAGLKLLLLQQYIDLFTLYKQEAVLARTIEESKVRLKDIRKMREEGLVTRNDEIRSELQLTNDQLAYRKAQDDIYIVSQQLDVVLGLDESLLLMPDTTLLYRPVELESCESYIEQAYENYPEMKLARYRTRLSTADKRLAKADYLPSLALHAGNALSRPLSSTMEDLFSNNWNVALSLSYNLSSLYHNRHKMREAQQYINLQKNAEEQLRQDIRVGVRSAYVQHQEALDRVNALLLSVRQAEENYRIVRNRYMNQLSILTDLLDASNLRLQEEMQLTTARANVIYTYYQLQRMCGRM